MDLDIWKKKKKSHRKRVSNAEILDKLARIESTVSFLYESTEISGYGQTFFQLKDKLIEDRKKKNFIQVFEKPNPLISIIIPAVRETKVVANSVTSALSQKHDNIEVILVVGESKNQYLDLSENLADSRLKIISNADDIGPVGSYSRWATSGASSRNLGMKFARGDFFCFLDDDDIMFKDKVTLCLNAAREEHSEVIGHFQGIRNKESKNSLSVLSREKFLKEKVYLSGSVDSIGMNTTTIFLHSWFKSLYWPLFSYRNMTGEDKVYMRMLFSTHPKFTLVDEILVEKNGAFTRS